MNKPSMFVPVWGTRLKWLLKAFSILTFNSITLEHQKKKKNKTNQNNKTSQQNLQKKYFIANTQSI